MAKRFLWTAILLGGAAQGSRPKAAAFDMSQAHTKAHPLHLHRHPFELAKIGPTATAGVWKDVVVAPAMTKVEVNPAASNPGPTLFHCHNQTHMDYRFMAMFQYM